MFVVSALLATPNNAHTRQAAYPKSETIVGVSFDLDTIRHCAPGNQACAPESDNWAITWADDDHQYTSWGDGGGFGGNNRRGRVSMGVARIVGTKDHYSAVNLNGGVSPLSGQSTWPDDGVRGGKCYGIVSIDLSKHGGQCGTLYLFRAGWKSGIDMYRQTELWISTDRGLNWHPTGVRWTFDGSSGFFCPTFCQYGRDHEGSGEYVYILAPEVTHSVSADPWNVQKPGKITLVRCRKQALQNFDLYQYFAGLDDAGDPRWSVRLEDRKPTFKDEQNGVMRTSLIYNAGLGRYILITQQVSRHFDEDGHMGMYESEHPWGPWKTILFANPWTLGLQQVDAKKKTVYWNISSKWLGRDGQHFVLVYTGPSSDQWGTVEGAFQVSR